MIYIHFVACEYVWKDPRFCNFQYKQNIAKNCKTTFSLCIIVREILVVLMQRILLYYAECFSLNMDLILLYTLRLRGVLFCFQSVCNLCHNLKTMPFRDLILCFTIQRYVTGHTCTCTYTAQLVPIEFHHVQGHSILQTYISLLKSTLQFIRVFCAHQK